EMRLSKGAPSSVLFALSAFAEKGSLAGDALAGWTSPAADRFRGFLPKTREEIGAKYQEIFAETDREWQKFQKEHPKPAAKKPEADESDEDKAEEKEVG